MLKYSLKRLLLMIPVMLGAIALVFTIMYFSPGDPATTILGDGAYLSGRIEKGIFHSKFFSYPVDFSDGDYELMLRSDTLLAEAKGPLTLVVRSVQFCGANTMVTLESADGAVWKKSFTKMPGWKPGDRVSFAVDMSKAVFFER